MFKIGDKVLVNRSKKCFPYAQDLANLMDLSNWRFGACPMPGDACTVVGKSFVPNSTTVVYGINDEARKQQFIIEETGVQLRVLRPFKIGYSCGDYFCNINAYNEVEARVKFNTNPDMAEFAYIQSVEEMPNV